MKKEYACTIIKNAVEKTRPTWTGFDESWDNTEKVFICRAYDQMGFDDWIFVDFLEKYDIYSIEKIGRILYNTNYDKKYSRDFAGSLESQLYQNMKNGIYGAEGKSFYLSVKEFNGRKGAAYYRLLWYMLVSCKYLKENYDASFSNYIKNQYAQYKGLNHVDDKKFQNISVNEWEDFKEKQKPWNEIYGVVINVFDYIMGDIVDLKFVNESYKLDSANERFLKTTGIINKSQMNHENVKKYLLSLNLPYSLREINKGLYCYTSELGKDNYGYCRTPKKCESCSVNDICEKKFDG